jgi:hypothetical protein
MDPLPAFWSFRFLVTSALNRFRSHFRYGGCFFSDAAAVLLLRLWCCFDVASVALVLPGCCSGVAFVSLLIYCFRSISPYLRPCVLIDICQLSNSPGFFSDPVSE